MKFRDYLFDRLGFILLYFSGISVALLAVWLDVATIGLFSISESLLYGLVLSTVLLFAYLFVDYGRRKPFYAQIERANASGADVRDIVSITSPVSREEKVLTELIKGVSQTYHAQLADVLREEELRQHFADRWVHYMKTPVSVIDLLIQQGDNLEQPGELKELLQSIDEENQRLIERLELFLNSVRMGKFDQDFRIESVDILEVSREVLNSHKKEFVQYSIFPKIECGKAEWWVPTDRKWIKFVIDQVVTNAIKYTKIAPISSDDCRNGEKKNPTLRILAEKTGEAVVLTIVDQGIGIPPEDIPRVFYPFFTGFNGRLLPESTGMGLYLAHKVIGKLGHTISIESGVGKGTAVTIRFSYDSIADGVVERT